jgi:hypothetical protein
MRRGDREYPGRPGQRRLNRQCPWLPALVSPPIVVFRSGGFAECAETTAMARTVSPWTFSRSQRVVETSAQTLRAITSMRARSA